LRLPPYQQNAGPRPVISIKFTPDCVFPAQFDFDALSRQ
jgi:hypothetical protein